jgi:predicted acylesterase/phospholipase RssA
MRGALHIGGMKALLQFQESLEFPDGVYGYSIGAIIATAVAFRMPLSKIQSMMEETMNFDVFLPDMKLKSVLNLTTKCGFIPMDGVEKAIVAAFLKHGVDLRNKVISDAPQKLYIGASNFTTKRPVMFTGNIPILAALKASACIPLFFQPQVVYGNVYLDGGVYMYYFDEFLPRDCLTFIVGYSPTPIRPKDIEEGNIVELVKQMYVGARHPPKSSNALWFMEDKVHVIHDVTTDDKERLMLSGYSQAFAFLTKLVAKEREQVLMCDLLAELADAVHRF